MANTNLTWEQQEEAQARSAYLAHQRGLDSERPGFEWEQEEAERRRIAWAEERAAYRLERESLSIQDRLALVMVALDRFSTVAVDRASGYNEYGLLRSDPHEVGFMNKRDLERHLAALSECDDTTLIHHVRALESVIDAHLGRAPLSVGESTRITEEKDKQIIEMVGLTPEQISSIDPGLGSPKAIRWVRSKAGRNPETGIPR